MASPVEEPSSADARPNRYLEEYGFRSTRLSIYDLKAVAAEIQSAAQRWTCFVPETLIGPEHVRRRSLTEWARDSLDDLVQVAPGGRIFHFELETDVDDNKIRLVVGAPWSKTHRLIVSASHGPEVETSAVYFRIADTVHASAKRGRFWHYLSSVVYTAAIFAAADLWLILFAFYKNVPEQELDAVGSAIGATVSAAFIVLMFSPLWIEGFKRLTASSVKLKPSAATRRAGSSVRRTWTWIRSVYSPDGNLEYKTYLTTHLGWIVAAVSMVMTILAWLYPRGK